VKIVDISLPLANAMPRFPSPYLPDVRLTPVARHEKEKRSVHVLTCGTHVSTHVDAPYHMLPDGKKLDEIPPDRFFGPARILRFPGRDKSRPLDEADFKAFKDLDRWEKLVLDAGWATKTWGTQAYFTDGPHLTRAAAAFLAGLPRLHLLAMDFPNVDAKHETVPGLSAPNHVLLMTKGMVLLENLIHLESVDETFLLSAAPPRLVGGDGCPCRALAVFPLSEIPAGLKV
jgi:arylformamidase